MAPVITGHDDRAVSDVDFFGDDVLENPYPYYDALRGRAPVYWSARHGSWIVTRYEDVRALLRDDRISHWSTDRPGALARWLHLMTPASGSRLRTLGAGIFAQEAVAILQHQISGLASSLIQSARTAGAIDAVGDYAEPIALRVMFAVIGIPPDREGECAELAQHCGKSVFAPHSAHGNRQSGQLRAFVLDLVGRRSPGTRDLLGALLLARRDGDPIDDDDVAAFLTFFMFAAYENSRNFIGNAVLALAQHPAEFARLTSTAELVPRAVEELLRFDSPVQFMMLTATAPIVMGGATIAAGDDVLLGIGAANRDPERFADPDTLDIVRPNCTHLTFGYGPLTCVGSALARLEGQIAIGALAGGCSRLALAGRPHRRIGLPVLRGLQSLPVALWP